LAIPVTSAVRLFSKKAVVYDHLPFLGAVALKFITYQLAQHFEKSSRAVQR
jgi:hypothetical protein